MFIDEAEVTVEGGHGGAGKVSFFARKAGPSGGDGGRGGSVYAVVNTNIPSLKRFVEQTSFKAANGMPGDINRRHGVNGADLHLQMPIGTSIIDTETGEEVELTKFTREVLLCRGGEGGRGNDSLKNATYQTPHTAEPGQPGQTRKIKLILKLIADYGLIGLPNAGKSTLLNALTAANVKTADYPFTTLEPNLGVIDGRIIADIPGLIEGASAGKGLGIKFLKHIEKVSLLLHCISVESPDIEAEYKTVMEELKKYNPKLIEKTHVSLLTKTDLATPEEVAKKLAILKKIDTHATAVSVLDDASMNALRKILTA